MSNARYFADGVDFWRVLYDNGSVDGPYIRSHAAKRAGESGIKLRQRWSYDRKTLLHEWRTHESYKIQKLTPQVERAFNEDTEEYDYDPFLMWEDWTS